MESVKAAPINLYEYIVPPTPPPFSFRVFEFEPASSGTDIKGRMHVVEFGDIVPDYEAISCAWGEPAGPKVPVYVDSKVVYITKSLKSALNEFRYKDRTRLLWTDVLGKSFFSHAIRITSWLQ